MADLVYSASSRARARARRRELAQAAPLLARLDWWMLVAVGGIVGYGLWAISGITRHDVLGDPGLLRQPPARLRRRGPPRAHRRDLSRPRSLPPFPAPHLPRDARRSSWSCFSAGEVSRGSRRWIDVGFFRFQPSEFGKLLVVLALAGFLADRFRRVGESSLVLTTVALAVAADPARLHPARHRLRARLRRRARRAAVRRRRALAASRRALVGRGARRSSAVLWLLPASGVDVLKPYQKNRLTGFLNPSQDPRGLDLQRHAVDHRGRLGRLRRPRREGCHADEPPVPARARDRLRVRLARGAARLPRCRRSC